MMRKILFLLFCFLGSLLIACKQNVDDECSNSTSISSKNSNSNKKSWTFIVYMAADNSLEASAIADFNEMENAKLPDNSNVLVLLDRSKSFDATNDDWSDTRLFEVSYDKNSSNKIISKRLSCEELDISKDSEVELDMANKNTLSNLLKFALRKYNADEYALIIWGHGTGWRNTNQSASNYVGGYKAFAIDEGNSEQTYMSISNLRQGIENGMNGKKLSFLGFDTCFGICLESAYEFRNCAKIMAGTTSIEPESGWNYESFFNELKAGYSVFDIADSLENQFKKQYSNYSGATFCVLDLDKCENLILSFNDFCATAASKIDSYAKRDDFISIFQDKCVSYKPLGFPCDFYVDSKSLVEQIALYDNSLSEKAENLKTSFDEFILSSWSSKNDFCSPGVFYSVFNAEGVVSSSHPDSYFSDSNSPDIGLFVSDCFGYVPSKSNKKSLLDKIFYTFF